MGISTISKPQELDDNASPSKSAASEGLQSISEGPTSFSDRVARLSISEETEAHRKIICELRNSKKSEDQSKESHVISNMIADKRRRRRSSAQSLNGSEKEVRSLDSGETIDAFIQSPRKQGEMKKARKESRSSAKKRRKGGHGMPIALEKLPGKPVSIRDLRDLMLACFGDTNYVVPILKLTNMEKIKKVIALFSPGLQVEDFGLPSDSRFDENDQYDIDKCKLFERLHSQTAVEIFSVTAPGSKNSLYPAYNHFLSKMLSKKDKQIRKDQLSQKQITINDLLMSLDDMMEKDFPIHPRTSNATEELLKPLSNEEGGAYVNTRKFNHDGSHIFALDCEMCLSDSVYVLTRVSVVDFDSNVVYDKLVKPELPITDYLTRYSGVTEEKLANVTTTLEDVQRDILNLVSEDDVLIGHSFENDLKALKIRHPKIVDTSVIYEHRAGPPFRPALRHLTSTYLSYNIQTGDKVGHDPVEDAKACMDLVKLKIVNGLAFGISVTTQNIGDRLSSLGARSLQLNENACRSRISNPKSMEARLRCMTDKEIFTGLVSHINEYDFFVGRTKGLALARGYVYGNSMRRGTDPLETPSVSDALDTLAVGIKDVYDACPAGTMIVVLSGNGDTRQYSQIMAELEEVDKEERTKERQKRAQELESSISNARDGVAAVFFKQYPGPTNSV